MNIVRLTPPPPSALTPAVPPELDALVARTLAKPVDVRSASALAVSSDLRRIAAALDARERATGSAARPGAIGKRQKCARVGGWRRDAGGAGCGVVVFLGT